MRHKTDTPVRVRSECSPVVNINTSIIGAPEQLGVISTECHTEEEDDY